MNKQKYFFPPHIGSKYGKTDGYFKTGLKILAVGNSYHCDTHFDCVTRCNEKCLNYGSECHNFTSAVVNAYTGACQGTCQREDWMPNFTKFARLLGAQGQEKELWKSIIQVLTFFVTFFNINFSSIWKDFSL